MYLKYTKNKLYRLKRGDIEFYYSFKINDKVKGDEKKQLIKSLKSMDNQNIDLMISKGVVGLMSVIDLSDFDLIVTPKSASELNSKIASKIKSKIPNMKYVNHAFIKNIGKNVKLDYDSMREKNLSDSTVAGIEKMFLRASEGEFQIKKIHPKYRKFIMGFLTLSDVEKSVINKMSGKVLVVDEYALLGTTFQQINSILNNYAHKQIINYCLFA